MFVKNKKDKKKTEFGDNGYQMKDEYRAENLVVAKFARSTSDSTGELIIETTEQKYIFEPVIEEGKTKYREIFTGFIASDDEEYFLLPYVIEIKPFIEYFPGVIEVPKLSLLWAQNDINCLRKDKAKQLKIII